MEATTPIPLSVISLLERLDPRLDEPCRVPGCVHHHPGASAPVEHEDRMAA